MALALVITYKTTEVPNFAQGDMAMVSAFIAYMFLTDFETGFIFAFGAALVFAFLLGIGFEGLLLRRMRKPTHLNLIIMTLGFTLALFGFAGWKWGADQRQFPFPVSANEVIRFGSVSISTLSVATILIAGILMLLVFAFFRFTKLGVAMQATQQAMQQRWKTYENIWESALCFGPCFGPPKRKEGKAKKRKQHI